jgi:hypothetical protein
VQNGGVRVHNVVGALISNPPPKRPAKNEPIVICATAPAATTQTAEDTGNLPRATKLSTRQSKICGPLKQPS